ncbi:TerC/Alx family metal homeostasis membrane protein [Edaphobacter sp. DSM 109919]|uniref:TerC/Alx family metal homeostasis membrane protein n=1 Tax=Edaphobacter paludis TaxID=3035702 RepID=A0AAU7CVI8_9BACT
MHATPISHWIGFHLFLLVLLACELFYARRRIPAPSPAKAHRTAVVSTILWIAAALAFAIFVFYSLGSESAVQYLAGYAIEESLSIDNLFVFLLLFRLFQIQPLKQPRVLFWGVLGAILMRGAFIAAGLSLLNRFAWISYVFAAILLIAAIRLVMPSSQGEETPVWIRWLSKVHPVSLTQDHFFVVEDNRRMATVLFLALVAIELADVVFALDSIPAVLSITRHPFLAYTSNIMAVMGLRSLYFLLVHFLVKLRFLHYGLAAVLAFAAFKMLSGHWIEIGPLLSLGVIIVLLAITVSASLLAKPSPQV